MFPPEQNTINVAGLAGGRQYEIHVSVFPKSEKFSHQESNKLVDIELQDSLFSQIITIILQLIK